MFGVYCIPVNSGFGLNRFNCSIFINFKRQNSYSKRGFKDERFPSMSYTIYSG